jgi:hypothetical protein
MPMDKLMWWDPLAKVTDWQRFFSEQFVTDRLDVCLASPDP